MCCASHKAAASHRERQLSIANFCANRIAPPQPSANIITPPAAASPEATATTWALSASSSSAGNIRVALSGTEMLCEEVLCCLHTVEKHHSLNSNENLSFQGHVSRFGYREVVYLWQGQIWIHHTIRVSTILQAGAHQHNQQGWPVLVNV